MSGKVAIQKTTLEAIGDAVRGKEGSTDLIPVNTLAERITALPAPTTNKLPQVVDRTVTEIKAEDLEGATSIGQYAFTNCRNLTGITFPDSVTSIDYQAFAYCTGLTSVTIPNSVTSVGDYAFAWSSNLSSVRIGSGITSIHSAAFSGDHAIRDIYIDKGEDDISGAPWGAVNATVHWNTPLPTEEA